MHIISSKRRLVPIVRELVTQKRTVFIRGTIGKPAIESIIMPDRSTRDPAEQHSIPFHCGSIYCFDEKTAVDMVDASLRKSISYAIYQFLRRDGFLPGISSPVDFGDITNAPDLLLAILHQDHIPMNNKEYNPITEQALVGDDVIRTLYDIKLSAIQVARTLDSSHYDIVSMIPEELLEILQSATRDEIKRARLAIARGLNKQLFYEDYKSWVRVIKHPLAYHLAVQTEIRMMERMLKKLEK